MDRHAVLAAFDEQLRRHPQPDTPDRHVEHDPSVVRIVAAGDEWTGVTWCDLDQASADAVIAAQIRRFAQLHRPWEWKHYSYDQPPDLPDRLLAAGFTPEPAEALLVAAGDPEPIVVEAAVLEAELGHLGDPQALESVLRHAHHPDEPIRSAVTHALPFVAGDPPIPERPRPCSA